MFMETASKWTGPFLHFKPLAPISDRDAWNGLDQKISERLISDADACRPADWGTILAADYLAFTRTGDRESFETKQFHRRTLLNTLVLAECAENKGRFTDDILNGIYAICEETAWQLPAHNSYVRDTPQLPLPETTRPIVDLFAAETGAVLAMVRYCMKPVLDSVSPAVSHMLDDVLERRIFTPYLTEHFWWMGDGVSHMNNWTVWCTQNVLLAAALGNLDEERQKAIFFKACKSMDYFLDEYGEDGCCDEGAQYYHHAGLCLFGCMEILNGMTDGFFRRLYSEPKLHNIAAYIQKVHVFGPYYINFSDCSPVAGRCGAREFLFGECTHNPALMRLAAEDLKSSSDPVLFQEHNLFYRLQNIFCYRRMIDYLEASPLAAAEDIYYPSVGLFIARDEAFCIAVKAGDNDDSHNHNDTGSFTVYRNGLPLIIDIGVETYQKKTFSPQRYEIWTMQSQFHNLPTFTGCSDRDKEQMPFGYISDFAGSGLVGAMQHNGSQYAARDVSWSFSPDRAWISMELADTYPDTRIQSYRRQVVLKKGHGITITDSTSCTPLVPVLSLITYEEPVWDNQTGILRMGNLGICRIGTLVNVTNVTTERIPITDKRLQTAWKHDIWRTLIGFSSQLQIEIPEKMPE